VGEKKGGLDHKGPVEKANRQSVVLRPPAEGSRPSTEGGRWQFTRHSRTSKGKEEALRLAGNVEGEKEENRFWQGLSAGQGNSEIAQCTKERKSGKSHKASVLPC